MTVRVFFGKPGRRHMQQPAFAARFIAVACLVQTVCAAPARWSEAELRHRSSLLALTPDVHDQRQERELTASLAASAFADSAREAYRAAMAMTQGLPSSPRAARLGFLARSEPNEPQALLNLLRENEEVVGHAAALAQMRAQESWEAVANYKEESSLARALAEAEEAGWIDTRVPTDFGKVSSEIFNPAMLHNFSCKGLENLRGASNDSEEPQSLTLPPVIVAFRQQIYNNRRVNVSATLLCH